MVKLSQATVGKLRPDIAVPDYDRSRLTPGIVHIGVGGFHRAHQAVYLDDLLAQGERQWAICGVGLLPQDVRMRDALTPQDDLYTVVARDASGEQARVIGSLIHYHLAPDDPEAVLRAMADPATRIVSLTITEGGYNFDQTTGAFYRDHTDIVHDLAHPDRPVGVFGYLAEALDRRRQSGTGPFTILSCDNVPHNGDVARRTVLAFADLKDPALAAWIAEHVTFPNSMVDRITPQTTEQERKQVREGFGLDDAWPVVTEPFRQWVVEDRFCSGRPALERVGVQFTPDVTPYEIMKIRLLNASHSAMGYLGYLADYRLISEVMGDPLFRQCISQMMDLEITPLLPPVPGVDLSEYKRTLLDRFANPTIKDQVARICLDGSSKVPKFLLPSIREQIERGGPMRLLSLAVAGWMRYLSGTDERGQPIIIDDPLGVKLQEKAHAGGKDPGALLSLIPIFGDLSRSPEFTHEVSLALRSLYDRGTLVTLAKTLAAA